MNKTMIFVISLTKSIERRKSIEAQFAPFGDQIDYQFFDAINGNENPDHPLFKRYQNEKRLARKGYPLSRSQLGCFASHYLLWQQCVALNQPIIILEDDAQLQPNFLEAYQFCGSKQNQFEFFWLFPSFKQPQGKLFFQSGNIRLMRFYKGFSSATGYFLSPKAAQKLLSYCATEWIYEVDNTMDRFYEHQLDFLGLEPACIKANEDFESNMEIIRHKRKHSFKVKLQQEFYKLKDNIKRQYYILKHKL